MASLRFLLGLLPDTTTHEEAKNRLRKEFEEFKAFEKSDELKHFLELKKEVESADFATRKKKIKSQKFKDTEEYRKYKEYKRLEKSKPIKNYYRVKDSDRFEHYNEFKDSDILKRYYELEKYVKSEPVIKAKAQLSPKEYRKSEEGQKEKEFFQLKKSPRIKRFFKFQNSEAFREYKRIEGSDMLKNYKELKEFVLSEKFRNMKEYMDLSPRKKYELSEEHKMELEYQELKESEKFQWYFKTKKKYPFKEIEKWELTFEEQFEGNKLTDKWLTRYLYGDKLVNSNYALADDKHIFTDSGNFELYHQKLQIVTKKEKAKGLIWDPVHGFMEKDFKFTSGLINSADSFKQRYGLFEAKVKVSKSDVTQSFSLFADQMLPHVDVLRYEKHKLFAGNFWKNGSKKGFSRSLSKTSGSKFTHDYYIYSLEWRPEKLVWKVNDVVFKEQKQGIPDEEMYLSFVSSLKEAARETDLPSVLEIDWVRAYQLKKNNNNHSG